MAETRDRHEQRILGLERDGYIKVDPRIDYWVLTEKGWRALSAAGEPDIKKPTKPSP